MKLMDIEYLGNNLEDFQTFLNDLRDSELENCATREDLAGIKKAQGAVETIDMILEFPARLKATREMDEEVVDTNMY